MLSLFSPFKNTNNMHTSELHYVGDLRTELKHVFSGSVIYTDAPLDNHGKGQNFSPTDLLATSLAACMVTIMGIESQRIGVDLTGVRAAIVKKMLAHPRKVLEIGVIIQMPPGIGIEHRELLERAAHNCPVAKSIHTEIKQDIVFEYPD
jgi:putative redox protein